MTHASILAVAAVVLSAATAEAVEILKKEPAAGTMRQGEMVYLDDGKCPKGQVTQLTAGQSTGGGRAQRGARQPRGRSCVPRPM